MSRHSLVLGILVTATVAMPFAAGAGPIPQDPVETVNESTGHAVMPPPDAVPAPTPAELGFDDASAGTWVAAGSAAAGVGLLLGARYITSRNVLKSEVRRAIMDELRRREGASLKELTEGLGLSTTNALWHLRKLWEAGLVGERKFHGVKVYYSTEGGVEARDRCLRKVTLDNENARAVYAFVTANPGSHQREIARTLGLNHGTVRWHLEKLQKVDLLTEVREGRAALYFPRDYVAIAGQAPASSASVAMAAPQRT